MPGKYFIRNTVFHFQEIYCYCVARHPPLVGLKHSLSATGVSCDDTKELCRNIRRSVSTARRNNDAAKTKFAERYNERHESRFGHLLGQVTK